MGTLRIRLAVVVALLGVAVVAAVAVAHDRGMFQARLQGFEEVPAVSTNGNGKFQAWINRGKDEIQYRLRYADTNSTVQQAHIHLGQAGVNGGIVVWLCGNNPPIANTPAGTQPCPPAPAEITGTIKPENIVTITTQGIATGEFDELVRAMRAGVTYANVHTDTSGGGEIRGQIRSGDDH